MNSPLGVHLIKYLVGTFAKLTAKLARRPTKSSRLANQYRSGANSHLGPRGSWQRRNSNKHAGKSYAN